MKDELQRLQSPPETDYTERSPCWAAEKQKTRILLVLHTALLLNFYDMGILGVQKCCICLEAKA